MRELSDGFEIITYAFIGTFIFLNSSKSRGSEEGANAGARATDRGMMMMGSRRERLGGISESQT